MQHNKKTHEGREERLRTLEQAPGILSRGLRRAIEHDQQSFRHAEVAPDDLLDIYVPAWTAIRIANGQANRVPVSRNAAHTAKP